MFEINDKQEQQYFQNIMDKFLESPEGKEIFFRIRIYKIILYDKSLRDYFNIFTTSNNIFDETVFDQKIQEWFEEFKLKSFRVRYDNIINFDVVKEGVYFSNKDDFDDVHLSIEILDILSQDDKIDKHTDQELVNKVINYAKSRLYDDLGKLENYLGKLELEHDSLMQGDEASEVVKKTKNELLKEIS